ncbi:MAG TPA: PA14 domain-containing protein [Acidobacteriaceae bacterium]|nr:PA14 domain-containing protein [Acidobacteriaceae bacterium]
MRAAVVVAVLLTSAPAAPQSNSGASQQGRPSPQSTAIQPTRAESGVLTFHVTTREVILDLIALDAHGGPVADLTGAELQVSYSSGDSPDRKHPYRPAPEIAPITSLHIVDPSSPWSLSGDTRAGFQITASCLERSTLHYQLAFRPGAEGWTSGYHPVTVTTTRHNIHLFYRRRYFVGETVAPPKPPVTGSDSIEKLLTKDACYYPDTPLSISLRARRLDTGRSDILRYQVAVDAASLSYLTLDSGTGAHEPVSIYRRVQIDYGVCTFNAAGRPIGFFRAPVDQVLTSADYARALAHGFPHILEFQASPSIALTRFVVRDRATGNLGATDVAPGGTAIHSTPAASPAADSGPGTGIVDDLGDAAAQDFLAQETAHDLEFFPVFRNGGYRPGPKGPVGSFGSVVPATHSFCGDVYELEGYSAHLPDFRELDPIGSLYAFALDVPNQYFSNTDGIPGVTPRTNLFGIDYHAVFWIRNAGDYRFRMVSDDGAILWIDDRRLIDLDGVHPARGDEGRIHLEPGLHTMHIPYYQGAVNAVALLMWVRPPRAKDWQIFDLRNFAPPSPATQ